MTKLVAFLNAAKSRSAGVCRVPVRTRVFPEEANYTELIRYPVKMPVGASTGPLLGRCWQHRPTTGPVLAHTGMFTAYGLIFQYSNPATEREPCHTRSNVYSVSHHLMAGICTYLICCNNNVMLLSASENKMFTILYLVDCLNFS